MLRFLGAVFPAPVDTFVFAGASAMADIESAIRAPNRDWRQGKNVRAFSGQRAEALDVARLPKLRRRNNR